MPAIIDWTVDGRGSAVESCDISDFPCCGVSHDFFGIYSRALDRGDDRAAAKNANAVRQADDFRQFGRNHDDGLALAGQFVERPPSDDA